MRLKLYKQAIMMRGRERERERERERPCNTKIKGKKLFAVFMPETIDI